MAARSEGWSVVLHQPTDTLRLVRGRVEPWGYVQVAWTAGTRADGHALLAELTATRRSQ